MAALVHLAEQLVDGLQWGRSLPAADGRKHNVPRPAAHLASMGPQPSGRGWMIKQKREAWASSFNGAAAFRPRMATRVPRSRRRPPCFNGAAAFRPRMARGEHVDCVAQVASMGPQPSGRGWCGVAKASRSRRRRFNGAAAFRPRMECSRGAPCPTLRASMGPQPSGRGWTCHVITERRLSRVLQWGRSLPAADGDMVHPDPALTWLLQWGRSLPAADGISLDTPAASRSSCFNGAAAFRPRMAGFTGLYDARL